MACSSGGRAGQRYGRPGRPWPGGHLGLQADRRIGGRYPAGGEHERSQARSRRRVRLATGGVAGGGRRRYGRIPGGPPDWPDRSAPRSGSAPAVGEVTLDGVLQLGDQPRASARAPARLANSVISYATVPRLADRSAITPSTEPLLIAVTSR